MSRVWLRWTPAIVIPIVIAAGAGAVAANAATATSLPAKTPEQVLALVGHDSVSALSGTLEQSSKLGLPELPTSGAGSDAGASSALELLTGSHTARVYLDGASKSRIQVMDTLAERDLIRNGGDVWLYSSSDNAATHVTLPAGVPSAKPSVPEETLTPEQLAHKFIAAADSSTRVTLGEDVKVAGRTAYDLVLTPRSTDTLVGSVSVAVDSKTGLPLRVDVNARGQKDPAFHLAFTSLSLATPSADLFTFTPPAGATVTKQALPALPANPAPKKGALPEHSISGSGWDSVLELPAGSVPKDLTSSPLFAQATKTVSGGRLFSTALVNVFLTDDGRVFAGAVPLAQLQAASDAR